MYLFTDITRVYYCSLRFKKRAQDAGVCPWESRHRMQTVYFSGTLQNLLHLYDNTTTERRLGAVSRSTARSRPFLLFLLLLPFFTITC